MHVVAKILGQLLLAVGGLWLVAFAVLTFQADRTAALGSAVLAAAFALPGWLFLSYGLTAERRRQAATVIQARERFTIDEIARMLGTSPEVAHAFIADQIARHGLALSYQQDTRGYARRGLTSPPPPPPPAPVSAPVGPCPACGSTTPRTEAGFCSTCGARLPEPPPRVRS
ncbi:MAG TPA: hypothetical protein VIG99_21865 [Myxococcaceae bacterium]|jgi:hypothetical protein